MGTEHADSLSIKLNAPELKDVNARLLKEPSSAALYNERARIYLNLRQLAEAESDAGRAVKLDSNVVLHYITLADVYFAQNSTRKAKELLERAATRFPDNVEAHMKLAELYFLVQQYQNAIDETNKALRIDVHHAAAYYLKGSVYKESGDTNNAVSSLQTAIDQDPAYEDAFVDLAVIFAARKNPIALQYYENALKVNAKNFNALYGRARLLQDLGRMEQALEEYDRMLEQFTECDNCRYNKGAIYLQVKKDYKSALNEFSKAIEANPNYLEAYFARGYTYQQLNDRSSARADYQMCLKLAPDFEPAIRQLNEL